MSRFIRFATVAGSIWVKPERIIGVRSIGKDWYLLVQGERLMVELRDDLTDTIDDLLSDIEGESP